MEDYQRFSGMRSSAPSYNWLEDYPVAMAYVPWQNWNRVYDLERGLRTGTIFPELDKPFLGVRGGCK